jgi:thiamine-monophosphate kinase
MSDEKNTTDIETVGEFGLIKQLTEGIKTYHDDTIKGVGDDAAVIDRGDGKVSVVSTDMLIEGVHFDLIYTPLKHLGYKAIMVNLSDIYAMNATPKHVTVSVAVSSRYTLEALEELYEGINLAAEYYKIDVIGGDTSSSLAGMCISITVLGEAKKEDIVYRSGAKEGDLLVVTGDLGGAFMGLQLLEMEKKIYKEHPGVQPDLDGNDYILERQLKPEARKDILEILTKLEVMPTSMIDISDGLASEILHLCDASKVGCHLYEEKIPIDPTTMQKAIDFNLDPVVVTLSGGEDYELLFTVDQGDFDKIKGNPNLTVIGHMVDESAGAQMITKGGQQITLRAQGWDAFMKQKEG